MNTPLSTWERTARAGFLTVLAALFCFIANVAVAAPTFPPLTGRVVDDAGILSADTQAKLTDLLAQQEKQTGDQVVVATLKSLQGYPIEEYGYQLGRAWGIGEKGKNNGALIVIAPTEHKVRIEVGYGLEGVLTDAQSKVIIDEEMTPAFKQGNFDAGVYNGTLAVLRAIGGANLNASPETVPMQIENAHHGSPLAILFGVFVLWLVFGRFFWALLFMSAIGGRGHYGGSGFGVGGFGGGFGGGGFGGGGGFSGGGGSFGGGGASGGW